MGAKEKFYSEFSKDEIRKLAEGPIATNSQMEFGDKVYVKDSLLRNYLCDLADELYDDQKIPMVFQRVCIEVQEAEPALKIYVSFFENHEDWFSMDVFIQGTWILNAVFYNKLVESEGRKCYSASMLKPSKAAIRSYSTDSIKELAQTATQIVTYVYLYAAANIDNTEIVEVEHMTKNEIGYETRLSKKGNPVLKKVKRTIPYTRRVVKIDKPNPKAEAKVREYLLSRWKVRGYSYTKKNGTVVHVKEHIAQRHYPNKGVDKTQLGTDYYLKKPANPNDN